MSGEKKKTEAEMHEELDKELESAADDVFGGEPDESDAAAQAAAAEAEAGDTGTVATDGTPGDEEEADTELTEEERAAKAAKDKEDSGEQKGDKDLTDEEKAAADKAAKDEEEDPYAIPDDVKGRTRVRMEKFRGDLKDAHAQLEEKTNLLQAVGTKFQEAGLNASEVESTLKLGSLLKRDPARAHAALTHLLAKVSDQIGETPPGADPLEGFDDLRQRVDDMKLTEEDAIELAKSRRKQAARERQEAQRTQQQQAQQAEHQTTQEQKTAYENAVAAAETEVTNLIAAAEKDPDFPKIKPILLEAATFAGQNLAPDKWMSYLQGEIKKAKRLAQELGGSSSESPLTDTSNSRHGSAAPKDLDELADQML